MCHGGRCAAGFGLGRRPVANWFSGIRFDTRARIGLASEKALMRPAERAGANDFVIGQTNHANPHSGR